MAYLETGPVVILALCGIAIFTWVMNDYYKVMEQWPWYWPKRWRA